MRERAIWIFATRMRGFFFLGSRNFACKIKELCAYAKRALEDLVKALKSDSKRQWYNEENERRTTQSIFISQLVAGKLCITMLQWYVCWTGMQHWIGYVQMFTDTSVVKYLCLLSTSTYTLTIIT